MLGFRMTSGPMDTHRFLGLILKVRGKLHQKWGEKENRLGTRQGLTPSLILILRELAAALSNWGMIRFEKGQSIPQSSSFYHHLLNTYCILGPELAGG